MTGQGRELVREAKMKTSLVAILWLGCLAAAGCRSDPNMQLLERELRLQEDMLYEMENLVDEYESKLDSCRQKNTALRKELEEAGPQRSVPTEAPSAEEPKQNGFVPPKIELPPGIDPLGRKRRLEELPAEPGQPRLIPADGDNRTGDSVAVEITEPDNTQIDRIQLNKLLTGGYNADGRDGDEGITAVIEPHDASGRLIAVAAPVSVVVLDPAIEGEAARVARWDFSAEDISKVYRKTPLGEGFCLEMPWPAAPPIHSRLSMFVRYTTSDGRKLQVNKPITVELAGRVARDWTAADLPATSTSQAPPPAASRQPPTEPIRTAARPNAPPRQNSAGKLQRPVWSPNR